MVVGNTLFLVLLRNNQIPYLHIEGTRFGMLLLNMLYSYAMLPLALTLSFFNHEKKAKLIFIS